MKLRSTRNFSTTTTWKEAVLEGLAPDGGLFVPEELVACKPYEVAALRDSTLVSIACELSRRFMGLEVEAQVLTRICQESFNFELPLVQLSDDIQILELFHGPTCAFKDFGARFMSRLFRHFWGAQPQSLTVLVATSGDTGSAVANAFFDHDPNAPIRVAILFPKDKVSEVQRKQMTTLGHNVRALEVDGSFDDCQALVKQALGDKELRSTHSLTSANSINIARLIPQMFYYAYASLRFPAHTPPTFIVPSGNLGNITGALLSHLCGFTSRCCIAACNSNSTFPDFMRLGSYTPRRSIETISNAMDVGAPSNFFRINSLMGQSHEQTLFSAASPEAHILRADTISDEETRSAMRLYLNRYNYLLDPHTAVGAATLERFISRNPAEQGPFIIAATAHPAKFSGVVEEATGIKPDIPPQLATTLGKPEQIVSISNNYRELLSHLQK